MISFMPGSAMENFDKFYAWINDGNSQEFRDPTRPAKIYLLAGQPAVCQVTG